MQARQLLEKAILDSITCPITLQIMREPVTLSNGTIVEKESAQKLFERERPLCPITRAPITGYKPCLHLNGLIDAYLETHPDANQYPENSAIARPLPPTADLYLLLAPNAPTVPAETYYLPQIIAVKPRHTGNTIKLFSIGDCRAKKDALMQMTSNPQERRYTPALRGNIVDVEQNDIQYKWWNMPNDEILFWNKPKQSVDFLRSSQALIIITSSPAMFGFIMGVILQHSISSQYNYYHITYSEDGLVTGTTRLVNQTDDTATPTLNELYTDPITGEHLNMRTTNDLAKLHEVGTTLLTHIAEHTQQVAQQAPPAGPCSIM
jgi:hypothetical protein